MQRDASGLPSREAVQLRQASVEILRRQRDFQRLRGGGRVSRSENVILVFLMTGLPQCRYAVVAGRRVGKATKRNRAKRVLREAQRRILRRMPSLGTDLLLIAKAGTAACTSRELEVQIASLYKREGLDHAGTTCPAG